MSVFSVAARPSRPLAAAAFGVGFWLAAFGVGYGLRRLNVGLHPGAAAVRPARGIVPLSCGAPGTRHCTVIPRGGDAHAGDARVDNFYTLGNLLKFDITMQGRCKIRHFFLNGNAKKSKHLANNAKLLVKIGTPPRPATRASPPPAAAPFTACYARRAEAWRAWVGNATNACPSRKPAHGTTRPHLTRQRAGPAGHKKRRGRPHGCPLPGCLSYEGFY